MLITISFQDAQATPVLKRYTQKLSDDVAQYFRQVLSFDWHFQTDKRVCLVKARLHARNGFYRATTRGESFRTAMDAAAMKLISQARRKKEIRRRRTA